MSQLRKEYAKSKQKKEEIVLEAALNWLSENVIVINEALDRKSVNRLIDSIQKFEDTFGPYANRLPAIKLHLDAAESGLEMVVTGRSSEHKTSNLLKQMSYLYSTLSNFFAKDLPVLLKSRLFRAAKEQPDQPLNMIQSVSASGQKHDLVVIKDALANALKPSLDEKKLLGKMYRSTKLPKLEPYRIAKELLSLSYNELEELTSIGRVPMVATPDEVTEESEETAEQEVAAESVFNNSNQLLTEGILTEASLEEVGPVLQQVSQLIATAGLTELQKPLNDLYTQLTQYMASPAGQQIKQTLGGADKRALGDFFKTPGGVLLKQANMAIETLKGIGKVWPKIEPMLAKPQITGNDVQTIKQLIAKQVSGGFFKKAAQAFGVSTKPFPGLEPENIADALTRSTLGEAIAKLNAGGIVLERRKKLDEADPPPPVSKANAPNPAASAKAEPEQVPADQDALQGVEKLKKAMTSLYQFSTGAAGTAKAAGTQVSTSAKPTQQTQNTQNTKGTETAGTSPAAGKEVAGAGQEDGEDALAGLRAAFPRQQETALKGMLSAINRAGYQLVKK